MKDSEPDAKRLDKLLKNYKHKKFDKTDSMISCDGISIKNIVVRSGGRTVVKFPVSIDGHDFNIAGRRAERVRDVYNRVYYCEPDDTPWHERLIGFGCYLAVCAVLVGIVYGAGKITADKPQEKQNISAKYDFYRAQQNAHGVKRFECSK